MATENIHKMLVNICILTQSILEYIKLIIGRMQEIAES